MSLRDQYEHEKASEHRTYANEHNYEEWLHLQGLNKVLAETGYYPEHHEVEPREAK